MSNRHLAVKLFGAERALAMAKAAGGEGNPPDWRGIFETTGAVVQCNNTVGVFQKDIPCYICGLGIPNEKSKENELRPECEHVLPVAEACWFLSLYSTKVETDPEILELEYAWAHRACNQAKSDDSFIDVDDTITFSRVKCKAILQAIKARASKLKYKYPQLEGIERMDIDSRIAAIESKINKIVSKINIPETFRELALLTRTAVAADETRLSDKVKAAYNALSGNATLRRENFQKQLQAFIEANKDVYVKSVNQILANIPAGHPVQQTIVDMANAKSDGLFQDWFTAVYSNVAKDADGVLTKGVGDMEYTNAYGVGLQFVLFRLYMNTYKLLPFVSENTNKELLPLKCYLLTTILDLYEKYNFKRPTVRQADLLKNAGLFIKNEEINEWILPVDMDICEKYTKSKQSIELRTARAEEKEVSKEDIDLATFLNQLGKDPAFNEPEEFADNAYDAPPSLTGIKRGREGGTKRAKSFPRTRRGRRSGLSKKLKKLSFRKRQMEK